MSPASVTPSARVEASGTFAFSLREEGDWAERSITYILCPCPPPQKTHKPHVKHIQVLGK